MDGYVPGICVIAALLAVVEIFRIHRRLDRIEALFATSLGHQGVDTGPIAPSEAVALLAGDSSTYVEAIKAYRQQTGLDLRSARDVVDRLVADRKGCDHEKAA